MRELKYLACLQNKGGELEKKVTSQTVETKNPGFSSPQDGEKRQKFQGISFLKRGGKRKRKRGGS